MRDSVRSRCGRRAGLLFILDGNAKVASAVSHSGRWWWCAEATEIWMCAMELPWSCHASERRWLMSLVDGAVWALHSHDRYTSGQKASRCCTCHIGLSGEGDSALLHVDNGIRRFQVASLHIDNTAFIHAGRHAYSPLVAIPLDQISILTVDDAIRLEEGDDPDPVADGVHHARLAENAT